jgi:hypothetical protein
MTKIPPSLLNIPPTPAQWQARRKAITLAFFLLCLLYATVTPIFEISDEVSHYPVVDYLADYGRLPVQDKARLREYDWEAAQPPLYYALAALLVAPFNRDDMEGFLVDNPHAKVGIGLARDNHNFVLYDPRQADFPWGGTPLHVRLVRLFSILLGVGSVWWSFSLARLAFPERPALALIAQAMTAFNPMFIAITASVNNDNLVICLSTLGLCLSLQVWREGFTWPRALILALVCTLCAAAKVSGMILFAPAGLAVAAALWRDKQPRWWIPAAGLLFLAVWGGLFGWWYLRNWDLYADPLGNRHMAETVGLRQEAINLPDLIRQEGFSFYAAYWGWFGTLNILAPMSLFYYTNLLWGLGALGLGLGLMKAPRAWPELIPPLLLLIPLLLGLMGLIQWTMLTPASQGRLLFPYSAALHSLIAWGMLRIIRPGPALLLTGLLGAFAAYGALVSIPQAYRLPAQLTTLPPTANPASVNYGPVQLVGYEIEPGPIEPGELLGLTLYWQAEARTQSPLSFYVQVFGPGPDFLDTIEVGKLDSYPGRGLLRTDTWPTGVIYADQYWIELEGAAEEPYQPRLKVGWWDFATRQEVPPLDANGELIPSVILRGGAVVKQQGEPSGPPLATFGGRIDLLALEAHRMPGGLWLKPIWKLQGDPLGEDFTVFVQLIRPDEPNTPLAFGDRPPRHGWWPTSLWQPGGVIQDGYWLPLPEDLPAGAYEIRLGFYRPSDFTRLGVEPGLHPNASHPDSYALPIQLGGD